MTKLSNVKGLIFDKDGTLFDFHLSWSNWAIKIIGLLSEHYKVKKVVLADAIQFNLQEKCFYKNSPFIAGTLKQTIRKISRAIPNADETSLEKFLIHESSNQKQSPVIGLEKTLKVLWESGFKLGVATNDAEISAIKHLQEAQIIQYFHFVAGYDSGYGGKPEPGQILCFCEKMGLRPTEVMMIGDSTHDLIASQKAEAIAIAVLTGIATKEELEPHAFKVINSIIDLPSLVIKTT